MDKPLKTLVLLDGNALIHRAYHALPPLTTKSGELVNAVYGYTSTLLSVLERFKPDYIAASFDLKAPTFRHKEFAQYKATRTKAPDELYAQIPRVRELTEAFDIPIYELEGYEADDMIGTLSRQANDREDVEVIIVTGDADALQLVNARTKVFTMRRGLSDTVLYDSEGVFGKYGFTPSQIPDYKGLRGDSSDNIPGVKGIGEKTATQLLEAYGTLEGVYEHIDEIKPAIREKLERDRAQAILSKRLGTIETHAPVRIDFDRCATHTFDRERVVRHLQSLNFFSLLKRLPGQSSKSHKSTSAKTGVEERRYLTVTKDNEERFLAEVGSHDEFSFALDLNGESLRGVAFCFKTGRVWYAPMLGYEVMIREMFGKTEAFACGYDIKKTLRIFSRLNIPFLARYSDVMLSAYVINPGAAMDLEHLIAEFVGEEAQHVGKPRQMTILGTISPEETMMETDETADYIFKLNTIHRNRIDEIAATQEQGKTVRDVLQKIELPLVPILAVMEGNGIKIDPIILSGINEKVAATIRNLETAIHRLSGTEFNVNSTKQTAETLFEQLGISTKSIKKTKTGYSTASSELEKIRDEHPVVAKIEEYRELFKLKTTYLDVLPGLADGESRIHTTFNQAVTSTGRLSSTDPNLQNIPIRTEIGQLVRMAFVAKEGYRLVSADYSQIDLRCVAHVSGDKKLIEAFHRNDDIHTITAAEINGVTPSQVTKKMRRAAKTLNFGVLYGMGTFGFMRAAGVDREEAQRFIREYMERFSGVAEYIRRTKETARERGYVETLYGRRRYVPEINSPNFQVVSAAERMAVNMPIQGLSADIMKLAMIGAEKVVAGFSGNARMLLQIHDELLFEVRDEDSDTFIGAIKTCMENVSALSVPLAVDVKSGENWGEL